MKADIDRYHSRYAPLAEAERYLNDSLAGRSPAIIIIIAGGKNYLGLAVSKLLPTTITILLQPTDIFFEHEVYACNYNWQPGSAVTVEKLLRNLLRPELLVGGVAVVEWPPVIKAYPKLSVQISALVKQMLEEAGANAASIHFWAERWLKNCLRFAKSKPEPFFFSTSIKPVVLVCAGPGLDSCLSVLKKYTEHVNIWCLASSFSSLVEYDINPELVFSTDPGFWNFLHQRALLDYNTNLAVSPSAYTLPDIIKSNNILPLNTGQIFEQETINYLGLPFINAAASGSSTGTALNLALNICKSKVFVIGYDLAAHKLLDHAKPYAFNSNDFLYSSRTTPAESFKASRIFNNYTKVLEKNWRGSRAFSVYASGISVKQYDYHRCIRFSDSPQKTPIITKPLDAFEKALSSFINNKANFLNKVNDREINIGSLLKVNNTYQNQNQAEKNILRAVKAKAEDLVLSAIVKGSFIPENAALYLIALAPKKSSEFLAMAARSKAKTSDAFNIFEEANQRAMELIKED